ncbi:MAG: ATP-binding protein [Oscillospiraceae bacterium]|nr:ATP-binding protein [Oscillospiraceae bacterium]
MAYSASVISRAKARLEQDRQAAAADDDRRIAAIYEKCPRLEEIDRALRATMAKVMTATFSAGGDTQTALETVRKENLALQQERSWLLQANEIDESDLERQPVCPLCGGTGYVGERMCECLRELCRQEQTKELSGLLAGRETFDGFCLDYYPEGKPRQEMERVKNACIEYAKTFTAGAPSMLFTGGTGLGKTHLSACIARQVAENGYSVVYDTAGQLFSDFEAAKFGGYDDENQSRTKRYLECDLLIIDDLGTEMITQFTQSVLYQVINTRMIAQHATIISTNLTPNELKDRYLPQIFSRLFGTFKVWQFYGEDIRFLRRKKGAMP